MGTMPGVRRTLATVVALLSVGTLVAIAAPGSPRAAVAPLPHVTLIGDSVVDAIEYDAEARRILERGVDLRLEVAPCRRVDQASCPYDGAIPQNVVQLVAERGPALGDTVIVAVGYNDYEQEYASNIENALQGLQKAGVERVLWVTLRAERQSYLNMNGMIRQAAARHSEMTVVDWNLYSRSHPEWFQPDGLHLDAAGATAMATLLRKALVDLRIPRLPLAVAATRIRPAKSGRAYEVRLAALGGTAPYRWTRARGSLPRGVRLTPTGRLVGKPAVRGRFALVVRVTDASRARATRRFVLVVS